MLQHYCDRAHAYAPAVGTIIRMPVALPRPLGGAMPPLAKHGLFQVVAYPVYDDSARTAEVAARCGYRPFRPMAHCVLLRNLANNKLMTVATHYVNRIIDEIGEYF